MRLHTLLADNRRRFSPEFRGITNHLSMALVALAELGADDDRLAAFFAGYAPKLEPAREEAEAAAFCDAVVRHGLDGAVSGVLDVLSTAIAGAAFHGLIRMAFAVRTRDVEEIAYAASYAQRVSVVLAPPAARKERSPRASRRAPPGSGHRQAGGTLYYRPPRRACARDERFLSVARAMAVDDSTIDQVSRLGARWYLAAGDFASLHVLTAAHALRSLKPWIRVPEASAHALATGALACFVLSGCPVDVDVDSLPLENDNAVVGRLACVTDDDHAAKLVLACLEEDRACGGRAYRAIATRVARTGKT